jgi:hypothetical protein
MGSDGAIGAHPTNHNPALFFAGVTKTRNPHDCALHPARQMFSGKENIMTELTRRTAFTGVVAATAATTLGELSITSVARAATSVADSIGQQWIDGWNSPNPETLVAAFTSDGLYRDVTFDLTKKGSAELRELHKFFHGRCTTKVEGAAIQADLLPACVLPSLPPIVFFTAAHLQ